MKHFMQRAICRTFKLALLVCLLRSGGEAAALGQDPMVQSVSPVSGALGVALDTAVRFVFSKPMAPQESVSWFTPPLSFITTVSYAWSADGRTLTATPTAPWPANSVVSWTLDDSTFEDLDGNLLSPDSTLNGYFFTGNTGTTNGPESSATSVFLINYRNYTQTNSSAPMPDPGEPYSLTASVAPATNRMLNSVSLTIPGGGTRQLGLLPAPRVFFYYEDGTNNLAVFNATYPDGQYQFNLQGNGSNQVITLNTPSAAHPDAPQVLNYPQMQMVNPGADFIIQMRPCGTTNEYVLLTVGPVSSPGYGEPGALNGTSTAFTIPANSLTMGLTYDVIICCNAIAPKQTNGVFLLAEKASSTAVRLVTTGGGFTPLVLSSYGRLPNGSFRLQVNTVAGTFYWLERAEVLPVFLPIAFSNATSSVVEFVDPSPPAGGAFYRVFKN